jgi:hypothetical protein
MGVLEEPISGGGQRQVYQGGLSTEEKAMVHNDDRLKAQMMWAAA